MCGIYGYSVKDSVDLQQRAILASVLSTKMDGRGGDSWGVSLEGRIARGLGYLARGIEAKHIARAKFVQAHTRKATTGKVSIENAHPFEYKGIVGAHNGIIFNHAELNLSHKRTCEVDSEHVIRHLAEHKPLDDIEGYGAVWYYNKKEPCKTYLFRSTVGDLYIYGIGKSGKPQGVIWSSSDHAILDAAGMAGLSIFPYESKPNVLYYIEDGKLYYDKDSHPTFKEMVYESGSTTHQTTLFDRDDRDYDNEFNKWYNQGEHFDSNGEFCDDCDKRFASWQLNEVEWRGYLWNLCPGCMRRGDWREVKE